MCCLLMHHNQRKTKKAKSETHAKAVETVSGAIELFPFCLGGVVGPNPSQMERNGSPLFRVTRGSFLFPRV